MNWLLRLFRPRRPGTICHTPRRAKPRVEILEDRTAPAIFTVNTTADVLGGPNLSLRQAILDSNATPGPNIINVPAGVYNLTLSGTSHDGTNGALLIENQDVTIVGAGAGATTIDANNIDRVIDIEGTALAVSFSGLTITGGNATASSNHGGAGGGIFAANQCSLGLDNTVVTANTASNAGGGIYTDTGGLGITGGAVTDNVVTLSNGGGGGIYASGGNITLSNTAIDNNSAILGAGGGLSVEGTAANTLTISGTTFAYNFAYGAAGAILDFPVLGNVSISGSTFDHNTTAGIGGTGGGGAIAGGGLTTTIADCTFTANADLNNNGGAVADYSHTLTITGSTFANNNATGHNGGGVYTTANTATLTGDTFTANTASSGGGLYYDKSAGSLTIANTAFGGALAGQGNNGSKGGGAYILAQSIALTGDTFTGNLGASGGGLYVSGNSANASTLTMGNLTFSANAASQRGGGADLYNLKTATLSSTAFTGNTALTSGGGLYDDAGATLVLQDNDTFSGNTAYLFGGGADITVPALKITGAAFTGNTCVAGIGGGLYTVNNAIALTLNSLTVSGNTAYESGGGIYLSGFTTAGIQNSTFANNTSIHPIFPFGGGGLFVGASSSSSSLTMGNVIFSGNKVGSGSGGGAFLDGLKSLTITGDAFTGNTALQGGGLYLENVVAASIQSSSFTDNAASASGANGGGLDEAGIAASSTLTMGNVTFSGNKASGNGGGAYLFSLLSATLNTLIFTGNTASLSGGGLFVSGTALNLTGGTFTDNSAATRSGGGLYFIGTAANLDTVNFTGNTAYDNGGGAFFTGGALKITAGTFTGNTASIGNGGGLYSQAIGAENFNTLTVSGNTAHGSGGGAYLLGFTTAEVQNSTFANNTCVDNGGGLYVSGSVGSSSLTLGSLTFSGNQAKSGGGIYLNAIPAVNIANSTFTDNTASGIGGGIYGQSASTTSGTLKIANSTFSGNSARVVGGGLAIENFTVRSTLAVTDSSFNYNNATDSGGGIYAHQLATATLANVNLIGNAVGFAGGGAYFSGTTFTMTYGNVYGNSAQSFAGGLDVQVATGTIAHTAISGNRATASVASAGGLYFQTSVSGSLAADTITNNQSAHIRSGVYWKLNGGTGTMTDTTVSGNSGGFAASLHGTTGALTITGSTFNNNLFGNDSVGGGIFSTVGTLYLTNDTIYGNTSNGAGGGLDVSKGNTYLLNDTISGNSARSGGGGVYAHNNATISVDSTIIAGNTAPTGADVFGAFTDLGHNLIGVSDGSTGFTTSTLVGNLTHPQAADLGPLQNNGGPTFTQAIFPGSPAYQQGDPNGPTTDQRGFPRSATTPSIGAFEPQTPLGTSPNQLYVESLYETLLNRVADPGAAGWVNLLNSGTPASSVVLDIEHSGEYLQDLVSGLYVKYLHRSVDGGGLTAWTNLLANGGTIEQVTQGITGSPEYFGLHGGSNAAFVAALYVDVLNRAPDAAGLAGWTNALNNGTSTAAVAGAFLGSQEYRTDLVESYYENYLGRQADPAGLAGWVAALNAGTADQVVLAAILGSPEAYGNRS